jgi:porin
MSFQGVVPGRPNDQFGFLGSFARVSRQARLADLDANRFNGAYAPLRNFEAILQATYAYNVADGFVLQPHVQYVLHPGAGVVDPMDPLGARAIRDAFVTGLRMTFNY